MPFDVIDAQKRLAAAERQSLRHVNPRQQRTDKSWSIRDGDTIHISDAHMRLIQCRADDGIDGFDMLARGCFGKNAAELGVQIGLAGDDIAEN